MSDCEKMSEIKYEDINDRNKQIQTTLGDDESIQNLLNTKF